MKFIYEATDEKGAITNGAMEADNREAVVNFLQKKNLIPVSIQEPGSVSGTKATALSLVFFETVTPIDRILMVRNLAAAVRAGVSIIEALDILIFDATKKIVRDILVEAKINLQNGRPLSATFNVYKKDFPAIFVGMLKAGEASGKLDDTLDELGLYLTKEYSLVRKVRSALAYPIILLIASFGVVILLLVFVLPRLTKVFSQSGVELPLITRVLVNASKAVTYSLFLDFIILALLVWFFTFFRRTDTGRRFFSKAVTYIPVARDLVKKVALVRFTRTLGSLIASGLPILEALKLASDSAGNEEYRKAIIKSIEQVTSGIPFSKTLEARLDLFPHFLVSLVGVGERTGTLEHILKTFSDFYDEEVDNTLKDLTTFLEPILLLFMGLIIGSVALSILLPIYQLVGKFT